MRHFRVLNTLVGRFALLQLLIQAVLPPVLFYRLDAVVRSTSIQAFTRHARDYTSSLATELASGDVLDSPSRTVRFLDGSVAGGGCSYAAVEVNGRLLGSSLTDTPDGLRRRGSDAAFGESNDNIYAVSVPIPRTGAAGVLFLGFDVRPTLEQIRGARNQIIVALIAYAIASVAVAVALVRRVARPLTQLQQASRRVARGDAAAHLDADSSMVEIVDLAKDLEFMRGELVGTAEQLRAEMRQRQLEQVERGRLESQLRHEQRLATIGTFAAGLAHEFNNILVPLMLYTEEALEEIGPEHVARPYLDRVMSAAVRAENVVSRMLAFSRPFSEHEPQPIDISAVVNEALELSQALIPANIELQRQIDVRSGLVLGDATLLNQVVLNLCSNAVRAMRDSGGTLSVSLTGRDRPATDAGSDQVMRVAELRVRDTGHGMSTATRERIFEPFFTTREVGDGSGLGLSVVHGIVASMGGAIDVVSEPGCGAEFIVALPAIPAPPVAA
jgi:signal transduction histidine kinase